MFELSGIDARDWETDATGDVSFAVVGLGGYARGVSLPAIAAGDHTTVGAVVSGDREKAERVAAEYDAAAMDYEAFATGDGSVAYDAAYVATPNRLHLPHVESAAESGAHVICEKPLEATSERAERAVEACEEAGVRLMTAYRMQCDPVVRRLRTFLADGGIGEPVKLFGDFTFPVLGSRGPDQWRLDPELAGGGALFDVGVYPLNTARFLLDADPVAVTATGGRLPADADSPFAGVDEHTHFHVEFPDAVGNFSASFSGRGSSHLDVVGTEGRVSVRNAFVPDGDRRVVVETDDGRATFENVGGDETREEFDYFAHAIAADAPIEPDGADGLTDVRVMEAVYEAADTGRRVTV